MNQNVNATLLVNHEINQGIIIILYDLNVI
jgi:hypothetical protein